MKVIEIDCPHCLGKQYQFNYSSHVPLLESERSEDGTYKPIEKDGLFNCFWTCISCGKGITTIVQADKSKGRSIFADDPKIGFPYESFRILEIFPSSPASEMPDYVSEEIMRYFIQGERSFKIKAFDACIAMMRLTLERAVIEFTNRFLKNDEEPITEVANLKQAIKDLVKNNRLTSDMASWADMIRLSANDVLHRAMPLDEEAEDIKDFTVMFLKYAFTLPEKVKGMMKRRGYVSSVPGTP
jgi:hypothetical protein